MSDKIILQEISNEVLEFIEITNKGVGCYDETGNMVIIKEPDSKQETFIEYEVISNKIIEITSGSTNSQYPSAAAVYNLVEFYADKHFHYVQNTTSNIWNVLHNLGKRPSVTVVDSAGTTVEGMVTYVDLNNLNIEFSVAFSGYAELN